MSEDNINEVENTEVEATGAEGEGKKTRAKKEKAEKAPKPQNHFWCGPKAAREGSVYNRLQTVVAKYPGLSRDDLIAKLQAEGFSAKNSKKFEENPAQFIGGYLTAGERKGFFVHQEEGSVAVPATLAVEKKEKAEKGPSITDSGRKILSALKEALGDRFADGEGIPVSELAERVGRTKTQLSRTLDKMSKEGMVEMSAVEDGDESIDYIYIQQKGVDVAAASETEAA